MEVCLKKLNKLMTTYSKTEYNDVKGMKEEKRSKKVDQF